MDSSIKFLLVLIVISIILQSSSWLWFGAWFVIYVIAGIIGISELWEKIKSK